MQNGNRIELSCTHPPCGEEEAYRAAVAHCAGSILRMHFAERAANKIFGRNLQSHAAGLVLVMHCEAEFGRGARPTFAVVAREMGRARTLAAFFGLLRLAGYVRSQPVPGDGRANWLVPSDKLFDGLRQWLTHHARCCEIMGLAEIGFSERLRKDDIWFRLYLAHARGFLANVRDAMRSEEAWAWFDRFECGDRIALILLHGHGAMIAAGGAPSDWFTLDSRSIASRLGVSHSHVRNVVNRAEARGLLRQDRIAGRIALTPRFRSETEGWFRMFWGWVAQTGREATASAAEAAAAPAEQSARASIPA